MWIGDVMATVVITSVHGFVQVLAGRPLSILILGLVDGAESVLVGEIEWFEFGQNGEDILPGRLAGAVGADTEELLDLRADDGPLGGAHWLLESTEVIVLEDLLLVIVLLLGEHGVHEEDW